MRRIALSHSRGGSFPELPPPLFCDHCLMNDFVELCLTGAVALVLIDKHRWCALNSKSLPQRNICIDRLSRCRIPETSRKESCVLYRRLGSYNCPVLACQVFLALEEHVVIRAKTSLRSSAMGRDRSLASIGMTRQRVMVKYNSQLSWIPRHQPA